MAGLPEEMKRKLRSRQIAGRLEARRTIPYSGSVSSVRYQYDNQNRLTGRWITPSKRGA